MKINDKKGKINYFAFGANLNKEVFLNKRGMKPVSIEPAHLEGFKLVFNHPGIPLLEPGFANIEPAKDEKVQGVLYKLSKKEFELLNKLEGGGAHEHLVTDVVGENSGSVKAHIFWMKEAGYGLKPSKRYLKLLIDGARDQNLPEDWIDNLEKQPTYFSALSPISPMIMNVFAILFKLGMSTPFVSWRDKQIKIGRETKQSKLKGEFSHA